MTERRRVRCGSMGEKSLSFFPSFLLNIFDTLTTFIQFLTTLWQRRRFMAEK